MDRVEERMPSYLKCFSSMALGLAPIFLIFGTAAIFGADTVRINQQPVHGVPALLFSIVANVVMAAVLAGLQKLGFVMLGFILRRRAEASA